LKWEIDESKQIHPQLVEEITKRIINGFYKSGDKIPSVREFALEARVNPNTMQKALQELEDKKIIYTKRTVGKFVTEDPNIILKLQESMIDEITINFINTMKDLGLNETEITKKIKEKLL